MYNSSKHTFGKQDKPNICLESHHIHIEQSKQHLVSIMKKIIIYLITHMYNSSAADDFGVILTIWFAFKLLFMCYEKRKWLNHNRIDTIAYNNMGGTF